MDNNQKHQTFLPNFFVEHNQREAMHHANLSAAAGTCFHSTPCPIISDTPTDKLM